MTPLEKGEPTYVDNATAFSGNHTIEETDFAAATACFIMGHFTN